ncbi:DUF7319 domain-containing protein [Haloarchaeobius sp. DFWS5]|uniref:DUF7319 domain-containing protein n=1 Tax=Haloarchaeobius sp. DFWS5 TaxID=3446114 RepID=UPI003EBF263A
MSDEEGEPRAADAGSPAPDQSADDLRRQVEEKYDFENFGPQDMEEMSYEEWNAAFDAESWITGTELLDRVESDLNSQIANRDVFAILERVRYEGQECLLAYSDEGYAMVFPDGSVDGFGTVLRDVKPTVALCSMDEYDPADAPAGAVLPHPNEVPEGSGELGNLMLQIVAGVLGLGGLALFVGAAIADPPGGLGGDAIARGVMVVVGIVFVLASVTLFLTVANARLSDRFRADQYKDRLRAIGLEDGERPEFVPVDATPVHGDSRGSSDGENTREPSTKTDS